MTKQKTSEAARGCRSPRSRFRAENALHALPSFVPVVDPPHTANTQRAKRSTGRLSHLHEGVLVKMIWVCSSVETHFSLGIRTTPTLPTPKRFSVSHPDTEQHALRFASRITIILLRIRQEAGADAFDKQTANPTL
ncbi:MAG: hypothetical protein OXI43_12670 [Candidatus Poribacteria bacterium]|nr:hypothetical protein [Candidatus Poribacteria bacterium]